MIFGCLVGCLVGWFVVGGDGSRRFCFCFVFVGGGGQLNAFRAQGRGVF